MEFHNLGAATKDVLSGATTNPNFLVWWNYQGTTKGGTTKIVFDSTQGGSILMFLATG